MSSLRERVIPTAKNIWDRITLGPEMRRAESTRTHLISAYGDEAWVKFPALMEQVTWIWAIRVMGAVALLGMAGATYLSLR